MNTNLSVPLKRLARVGAITAACALSLGSTGAGGVGPALTARTSNLNPQLTATQPVTPVVQEAVVTATPDVPVAVAVASTERRVTVVKAASIGVDTGDIFARIRACESHGNYSTNTGNGYYGAYQYDRSTWNGYGGYATADQAPASTQDQKAKSDYARRGGSPWPVCSHR